MKSDHEVVVAAGVRTPFLKAGTGFAELSSYDLAREAIIGLRRKVPAAELDAVILGTVAAQLATSNVAREAMLAAGIPSSVPAHTVTQACISANQAISQGWRLIRMGDAAAVIAGGTEALSDIPIQIRRPLKRRLMALQGARTLRQKVGAFKGLGARDLLPEIPQIAEFSTGLTMGEDCDRLAARFHVDRPAQDEFAMRSHRLAGGAWDEGFYADHVVPVAPPPAFDAIARDNGMRPDADPAKVAALPPAFVRPGGTVTAANSSFLTDGAATVLLMSTSRARQAGVDADVVLRDTVFSGQSPADALLLGPAHAIALLLSRHQLKLADVAVFELHEAFAGQVLANLKALASDTYCREQLGRKTAIGEIPLERINTRGGSLSLGHPFGATGARLVHTAALRLRAENARYAIVAACAAGGLGNAMLLERR